MIFSRRFCLALLAGALLTALSGCGADPVNATRPSPEAAPDPAAAARLRVFFGHQSVGRNLLDGIAAWAAANGGRPRIVPLEGAGAPVEPGTIVETPIGENGHPDTKLDAFAAALRAGLGRNVDAAGLKFCYLDFEPSTDVDALFARYRKTFDALQREFPNVAFFHVTPPLTTVEGGPSAMFKRLLGKPTSADRNAKRRAFGERLKQAYGDRVFDLQTAEMAGDGPRLAAMFTDDGGHLNANGKRAIAPAFLAFLERVGAR